MGAGESKLKGRPWFEKWDDPGCYMVWQRDTSGCSHWLLFSDKQKHLLYRGCRSTPRHWPQWECTWYSVNLCKSCRAKNYKTEGKPVPNCPDCKAPAPAPTVS